MRIKRVVFAENIREILQREAERLGLSEGELIKYIVGQWAAQVGRFNATRATQADEIDPLMRLEKKALKLMINKMNFRCKDCAAKITVDDITSGKCHACGAQPDLN